jgi:hypothetical protein
VDCDDVGSKLGAARLRGAPEWRVGVDGEVRSGRKRVGCGEKLRGVIAMMALGERTLTERAHHEGEGQVGFGGVVGIEFQEALVKMRDKPCRSGGGGY